MEKFQQEFIENLKRRRKERKLSQEKFAELCNVSTSTIGNIECGIAKPSFDLLMTMGNVLGVHPALLLSDSPAALDGERCAREHTMLVEIYSRLKRHLEDSPSASSPAARDGQL